ncbi:hypothetical protein GTP41_15530 [Pseudoduganella sp. DS3]|uniref:Uncharacterized protein n=1 Tax=Pseudoduganella guangdongensis TaxID=2692179 RepID=A0A6N9HJU9_9BURK|nr:hypothetical protein [Pseudoduganella guangdongensis]MYN03507.1 hypothetical protein [Pseudoduganella guangdongensis]
MAFGVLLTDEGVAELGAVLKDYLTDGPSGKYLPCKEANPDRSFFHLIAEMRNADGVAAELELYVPNRYIKLVMSGLERKHIGFL